MNKKGTDLKAIKLFTIGFTHKSAEQFFHLLENAGVKRIIDIRLHNSSQLAGFAKRDDLEFFLKRIAGIEYLHMPELAPTDVILKTYKKKEISWNAYKRRFLKLLEQRNIAEMISPEMFDRACLLCSEASPDYCHRRLVAEYISKNSIGSRIGHLV